MTTTLKLYRITYWTGTVECVPAASAHDAALAIWGEDHLNRWSIDQDLLDTPDMMVVMSENWDRVAEIRETF